MTNEITAPVWPPATPHTDETADSGAASPAQPGDYRPVNGMVLARLFTANATATEALWTSVRAARVAGQMPLMAELERLANDYEALVARVKPAVLFKPL